MLIVADADAAVTWYREALGASELWNLGGVAGLEIDGAPFFLHEANPRNPVRTARTVSASPARASRCSSMTRRLHSARDRGRCHAGLRNRGARAALGNAPPGGFHDPFGHNWSVGDRSPLSHRP